MHPDIIRFFFVRPQSFALYAALEERILAEYPSARTTVHKTQINFEEKRSFAIVWLPLRRMKNKPEEAIMLTFGLAYKLDHPRIEQAVEVRPNRWTHHMVLGSAQEVDEELMGFLRESYDFSMRPSRGAHPRKEPCP